jgi:hypothetical protein
MAESSATTVHVYETSDGWKVDVRLSDAALKALAAAGQVEVSAERKSGELSVHIEPNLVPGGQFDAVTLRISGPGG